MDRRGQSLVEIALIMPFLVLICVGVMDLGFRVMAHLEHTGAAQEVTKLAALNEHTENQLRTIYLENFTLVGTKSLSITTTAADPALGGRPSATIDMSVVFPPIGLGAVFRNTDITFSSRAKTPVMTNSDTSGALIPD